MSRDISICTSKFLVPGGRYTIQGVRLTGDKDVWKTNCAPGEETVFLVTAVRLTNGWPYAVAEPDRPDHSPQHKVAAKNAKGPRGRWGQAK